MTTEDDAERGAESLEPPRDSWRPPAPDAPLELHSQKMKENDRKQKTRGDRQRRKET